MWLHLLPKVTNQANSNLNLMKIDRTQEKQKDSKPAIFLCGRWSAEEESWDEASPEAPPKITSEIQCSPTTGQGLEGRPTQSHWRAGLHCHPRGQAYTVTLEGRVIQSLEGGLHSGTVSKTTATSAVPGQGLGNKACGSQPHYSLLHLHLERTRDAPTPPLQVCVNTLTPV